ncbi:MAG: hypothetical protein ACI9XB_003371, partial [Gammaproteobacteria bacterium]
VENLALKINRRHGEGVQLVATAQKTQRERNVLLGI